MYSQNVLLLLLLLRDGSVNYLHTCMYMFLSMCSNSIHNVMSIAGQAIFYNSIMTLAHLSVV